MRYAILDKTQDDGPLLPVVILNRLYKSREDAARALAKAMKWPGVWLTEAYTHRDEDGDQFKEWRAYATTGELRERRDTFRIRDMIRLPHRRGG